MYTYSNKNKLKRINGENTMIIGNRETFIGIKLTSIIGTNPFFHYEKQENYTNKSLNDFSANFIQKGQSP